MESPKSALRHLYAAIQIFRRFEKHFPPAKVAKLTPIYDSILRFDFLAMKLVPYASSSFSHNTSLAFSEISSAPGQLDDLSLSPLGGKCLSATPSTIAAERHGLMQLVSSHNKLSRVVWGPWYPVNERPSREELLDFYSDLLSWRGTSTKTAASCVSDPDSLFASNLEEVSLLPIPPDPLKFASTDAAVNIIIYNGFLGCALAALSTTDIDPLAREIESFNSVYQMLRISSGLLSEWTRQDPGEYGYRPCDSLDVGISMFLYHSARRCFSPIWQQWIVSSLHAIGREGLLNAHSFANALDIMAPLQRVVPQVTVPTNRNDVARESPLGHLNDRLVPVVLPKGEKGEYVAYFLRYGITQNDSDENVIRAVGLASWTQDDAGNMQELQTEANIRKITSQHVQGSMDVIESWREKAEVGWHGLF